MCLLSGSLVAAAEKKTHYEIKAISKAYQMGKFPYLYGGGSVNIQPDEQACMKQCMKDADCKYGTFVTAAKKVDGTHAFSHQARFGECWLSKTTHEKPVQCGVPCKGFQKVEAEDELPPTPAPNTKQTNECACNPEDDPHIYMSCMSHCTEHGLHNNIKRSTCMCNPNKQKSKFTTCEQDAFSYHINVHHLQPRFHTEAMKGGEQHRCMMISDTECSCCDCHDAGFYHIREIGFGMHTAAAPFLTEIPPKVTDLHACQSRCNDTPKCRAGTFISGGESKGECWLSENLVSSKKCVKPCDSFIKVEPEKAENWESPNPIFDPKHGSKLISPEKYQGAIDYFTPRLTSNVTPDMIDHEDELKQYERRGDAKNALESSGTQGLVAKEPQPDVARAAAEYRNEQERRTL